MKILFLILAFAASTLVQAQEPVVFHFNFSFEKEYGKNWNDYRYSNFIDSVNIEISASDNVIIWNRFFKKTELTKDESGSCLLIDSITNLQKSNKDYSLNVKYWLGTEKNGSSVFDFKYPDSVNGLALELFFDQSKVISTDYEWIGFEKVTIDHFGINENPKPVLVVKYLKKSDVMLLPVWFSYIRINPRPRYYLMNNGSEIVKTSGKGFENYFSGHLYTLDSSNIYKNYFFGFECGNVGGKDRLAPGETDDIVEGFTIGDPQKLKDGFYKYSVGYLKAGNERKNAETYFSVIYSK